MAGSGRDGGAGRVDPDVAAWPFAEVALRSRAPLLLADARRPDCPVVFANDAFLALTGYARAEVLGRNCRFLQGPGTDPAAVAEVRAALAAAREASVVLLNHRKDGTPFWNDLFVAPILGRDGQVSHFLGMQQDVTGRVDAARAALAARDEREALLREVNHRVRNTLQAVSALVSAEAAAVPPVGRAPLDATLRRLRALALAQRAADASGELPRVGLGAALAELSAEVAPGSKVDAVDVRCDIDMAGPVLLLAGELAWAAGGGGPVRVSVRREGVSVVLEVLAAGGAVACPAASAVLRPLCASLGADLRTEGGGLVAALPAALFAGPGAP